MRLDEIAVLLETPMRIEDFNDLALDNYEQNRTRYDLFVKMKPKNLITVHNGIELYALKLGKEEIIVGLNHSIKQVAYYCNYEVKVEKGAGRTCSQIMVWSDRKPKTKDIPRMVFFTILLKKYKTMQTDTMQTSHGERFWKNNVKIAFEVGYNVYMFNNARHRLTQIPSYKNFLMMSDADLIWGDEFMHGDITILISQKDLKPSDK